MSDLALLGFRRNDEFKVIKIDKSSPYVLGNLFALQLAKSSSYLVNDNWVNSFFNNIILGSEDSEDYFIKRFLPETLKKIEDKDFSFIRFAVGSRHRISLPVVIPDFRDQLEDDKIKNYQWAYIYNFLDKKIEFYGRNFPIKQQLESPIGIPYYASISINFCNFIAGFQKNFDVIEFLARNHEQEIILNKSLKIDKPHKHKEKRGRR